MYVFLVVRSIDCRQANGYTVAEVMDVSDEYVNQTQFAAILGVSKEAVRQLRVKERPGPPFPDPIRLGAQVLMWPMADVLAYAEARKKYLQDRRKTLDSPQA